MWNTTRRARFGSTWRPRGRWIEGPSIRQGEFAFGKGRCVLVEASPSITKGPLQAVTGSFGALCLSGFKDLKPRPW